MLDDAFQILVFADELERGARADSLDGVNVIATEEDAEIDELIRKLKRS